MAEGEVDAVSKGVTDLQLNGSGDEMVKKTENPIKNSFAQFKDEGNALVKAARYDEALDKYDQAWKECQTNDNRAMILNNRGVVQEKLGNTEKAMEMFNDALAIKPDYVKVLLRRGLLQRKLKNFEQAIEDISEAQVLAVKNRQTLDGLQENVGLLILEYAEAELEKIKMTRSFGFPKDAYIKTYFRGFYFDPVSRIWKGLDPFPLADCQPGTDNAAELSGFLAAMQCMMANEFTSVPDHCSKEIEKPEGKYRLEALLLRGSFRFLQADRQGAMADFQAVIDDANAPKEFKSSAHLKAGLCENLWSSTGEETAFHFGEAERIWSQNGDVYYHAAVCLVDKGEAVPALALLGKGTDECPDPKTCPLLHALRLSIQSSYQALSGGFNEEFVGCCISAKECLQKLQEMERSGAFHNSPESYELYAQALLLLGETEVDSIEMFDKAIQFSGQSRFFELKKAMASILKMDDRGKALSTLEAFTDDPDVSGVAYYHIGEIKMMLQKFDEGFEAIEKSIEKSNTIYEAKLRVMGKMDFNYHIRVVQKMKQHEVDLLAGADEAHKALD